MGYGNGYAGSPIPTAPTVLPFYRLLYAITGSYTLLPVLPCLYLCMSACVSACLQQPANMHVCMYICTHACMNTYLQYIRVYRISTVILHGFPLRSNLVFIRVLNGHNGRNAGKS